LSDDLVKPFFGQGALGGALLSPCWDKSKCLQYTCEFAFAYAMRLISLFVWKRLCICPKI